MQFIKSIISTKQTIQFIILVFSLPLLSSCFSDCDIDPNSPLLRISKESNYFRSDKVVTSWHRGAMEKAQENSLKSIQDAFNSPSPHIEVDIMDFTDDKLGRIGLLSHDEKLGKLTGSNKHKDSYHTLASLPPIKANSQLPAAPFISVIDLFEEIKKAKAKGITPFVSLDMKESGTNGYSFGKWIGHLISQYKFEDHVFTSSFYASNVKGVKDANANCLVGGLIFQDHPILKFLSLKQTTLDLTHLVIYKIDPDFILIHDQVFLKNPEVVSYWKTCKNVKFIGVFASENHTPYTNDEIEKLKLVEWLELDTAQIKQFVK